MAFSHGWPKIHFSRIKSTPWERCKRTWFTGFGQSSRSTPERNPQPKWKWKMPTSIFFSYFEDFRQQTRYDGIFCQEMSPGRLILPAGLSFTFCLSVCFLFFSRKNSFAFNRPTGPLWISSIQNVEMNSEQIAARLRPFFKLTQNPKLGWCGNFSQRVARCASISSSIALTDLSDE